jgi:Domain of unknown function (DUF6265)
MAKLVFCITILLLMSTPGVCQQIQNPKWIVGTWIIKTGKGTIAEEWKMDNDSSFSGKSVFIMAEKDSVLQETLELSFRNGSWHYISKVVGQNNNLPVSFQLIYMGKDEFISENTAHDFPQRISYRRVKNELFASIEGKSKGRYLKQNFDYSSNYSQ